MAGRHQYINLSYGWTLELAFIFCMPLVKGNNYHFFVTILE